MPSTQLTSADKWTMAWLAANFYIHFGWEMSLLKCFDYLKTGKLNPFNPFVQAFYSFGNYDRRYRREPADENGSNVDKFVLAVEVPAGIVDGALCCVWLSAILNNAWYRLPVQLTVSALHAFGTIVYWADELVPGWMSWSRNKGWKWTNTDGPGSIHWWWAFIGTNAVWVIVPLFYCRSAVTQMRPALEALTEVKILKP